MTGLPLARAHLAVMAASFLALVSPASALELSCALDASASDHERMGLARRIVIDEERQVAHFFLDPASREPDWTFVTRPGDSFDPKGDVFVVHSDRESVFGSGVRGGTPSAFLYTRATRVLSWSLIWRDRFTRLQWRCE